MAKTKRDLIQTLQTGVPGFDEVLGGGLPKLSFTLLAGGPGAGKTTLAVQTMFANSTVERPGLFFTVVGEPSLKLLRYQQQFDFFDATRIGKDINFHNLTEAVLTEDLDEVMTRIVSEVEQIRPGIVVIDSFRSLVRGKLSGQRDDAALDHFVQRLALHLTTWEVTALLVGEYTDPERQNPVFTVADGVVWLTQAVDRNSVVRKLQVVKMRGIASMPGLHTLRITRAGVQVFPRMVPGPDTGRNREGKRLSTGIRGLDEMMGGGIPAGDSLVFAGPTGTGKTTFASQFVAEGIREGEASVVAVFEEHPREYLSRTRRFGADFEAAIGDSKLRVIYLRPLDLSVDETLDEISNSVREIGATRVVIDSISGFEVALAPTFREDFRESLYRLVNSLTALGVTVVLTVELVGSDAGLQFTKYGVSFLTDNIVVQRYAEIEGQLLKVLAVAKMRGSQHSRDFRGYDITAKGVVMGDLLREYDGIITGVPKLQSRMRLPAYPGLTDNERRVLETLVRGGPTTIEVLAKQTSAELDELDLILQRLQRLGYVSRAAKPEGGVYQGIAQAGTS